MPIPAGTRLGPYTILSPLGAGGMGEVYRARDTRLDREVAIKVLAAQTAGDPAAAARLAREARAVAAISHPNVLGIFDVGDHEGVSFVVTELLEGRTLREHMARALPYETVLPFGLQIAHGLAAAHDKGVVHRDLKPENLFVTRDRRVKILDFGLARQSPAPASTDETTLQERTDPGVVMGTVGYMSPEQARGQTVDHRSDLFAFGAILFEMLSGRRAFRGDTSADTMAAIVRDEPPELRQLNPAVPVALARIVARCLAKLPAERFQSTHDLALALEAISGSASGTAAAPPDARTEKGLVVLPFENMSAEADNEFFADGLTEEIISDLSKIHDLRVISRTSAMQLKGRQVPLPALVRDLDVRYVLEGGVRRSGNRLRITAQLIDAVSDTHLWSEKYSGTIEDVFDIQERVARAIADALRVKLTPEESAEMARRPITDPAAYDAYLRARACLLSFSADGVRAALRHIDEGLRLAGDNVLMLSVKGEAAWQLFNVGEGGPAQLEEVAKIGARVEALESGSPHGARLLALTAVHSGRLGEGAQRLRAVVAADPSDTLAMGLLGFCAGMLGRPDLARAVTARLIDIDPLHGVFKVIAGWVAFADGRFEAAVALTRAAHRIDPLNPQIAFVHALALAAWGRVEEAITVCEAIEQDRPRDKMTWFAQAVRWALRGETESLLASVSPERRAWSSVDPHYSLTLAECFAVADRPDEAFAWLEHLLRTGATPYEFIADKDPFLTKLRTDPRWPPFVARLRAAWQRVDL